MTTTTISEAHRRQRVIGALVGSVVGDALGAPFEFGPAGEFTARFGSPALGSHTEMCGGGGWRAAEWTDDTQMALLVAASLLDHNGLNEADLYARFTAWLAAGPADVGIQTRQVLTSGLGWRDSARRHFEAGHRAAGNGSLMRTTPAAIFFAGQGGDTSAEAARRISALTHGDPAAGDGCAIYHRLIGAALAGDDPSEAISTAVTDVHESRRAKWQTVLGNDWTPADATEPNGAVWPTLGSAVWALRRHDTFAGAMRAVIDFGGDTDTVAAVTGGLFGATHGIQSIPCRWSTPLRGELPGHAPLVSDLADLQQLALTLDGHPPDTQHPPQGSGIEPVEVLPRLWLCDLDGAVRAPKDVVVISLCRTFRRIPHALRRQVYLTDDEHNLDVDCVLHDALDTIDAFHHEGRDVLVHCFGGASRTGLVLRAWLRRTEGLTAEAATARAGSLWPHLGLWNQQFNDALAHLAP